MGLLRTVNFEAELGKGEMVRPVSLMCQGPVFGRPALTLIFDCPLSTEGDSKLGLARV